MDAFSSPERTEVGARDLDHLGYGIQLQRLAPRISEGNDGTDRAPRGGSFTEKLPLEMALQTGALQFLVAE
jgi:hypothetical protein